MHPAHPIALPVRFCARNCQQFSAPTFFEIMKIHSNLSATLAFIKLEDVLGSQADYCV